MAVASLVRGEHKQTRNMHAPKRASEFKYWYRAAQKAIKDIPDWIHVENHSADVESIHFSGTDKFGPYDVFIARKRHLW